MEIIAEILFFLLELIGELLLQVGLELFAEFGLQGLSRPLRPKPVNPFVAALGYLLLGTGAGWLTLWLLPHNFIHAPWLRIIGLIVVPVAAGASMSALGAWRKRKDQTLIRLDRFSYGFLFAFAMALVRFFWGK